MRDHFGKHPDGKCGRIFCLHPFCRPKADREDPNLLEGTTPGPWHAYYNIHGDPFVVTDPGRPAFSQVAVCSPAPDDYGRANARLIAAAPDLASGVATLRAEREEALRVIGATAAQLESSPPLRPEQLAADLRTFLASVSGEGSGE